MKTTIKTKAGIKILDNGKHIKTISCIYENFALSIVNELDLTKKRTTKGDRIILNNLLFEKEFKEYLNEIKITEPYVYELVSELKPKEVRKVNLKEGYRYELVFINDTKIKIPKYIFNKFSEIGKEVFLNY